MTEYIFYKNNFITTQDSFLFKI